MRGQVPSPIPAVLAVVFRDQACLLVRRANPPDAGLWGFPGGKVEFGETLSTAALRELREETAIQADFLEVLPAIDALDADPQNAIRHHFILIPVLCAYLAGTPVAGDDALDVRWMTFDEMELAPNLLSAGVVAVARLAKCRMEADVRP